MKTAEERFWFLVDKKGPEDCWPYQGALNNSGYGRHTRAYRLAKGEIPLGMIVMHACNNRTCCNPRHLVLGTQAQNIAFARLCGRLDNARKSLSVRATKQGTGVQHDRRANWYCVMFKVLGKPLYVGGFKDKELAEAIAKAAIDHVNKLLTTQKGITYEEIKAHFHEEH